VVFRHQPAGKSKSILRLIRGEWRERSRNASRHNFTRSIILATHQHSGFARLLAFLHDHHNWLGRLLLFNGLLSRFDGLFSFADSRVTDAGKILHQFLLLRF
jgi:hypothetical protein